MKAYTTDYGPIWYDPDEVDEEYLKRLGEDFLKLVEQAYCIGATEYPYMRIRKRREVSDAGKLLGWVTVLEVSFEGSFEHPVARERLL